MRLDELREEINLAISEHQAEPSYGVIVCLDGDDLGIDHVEMLGDGCFRIHLESK